MKKVHFIGVGGSGCAGCAMMALNAGYKVSGCGIDLNSSYLDQVKDTGEIELFEGHDLSHVKDADIVACSPAVLGKGIEEVDYAFKDGKLMKWQHFLGDFVMKDKKVIAICGTHGKTSTTSMLGTSLENAGVDPSVFVGGVVPKWDKTIRVGQSDIFVIEADEYDSNFIKYAPDVVILNNAEMEHPEIFDSEEEYMAIFENFLRTVKENGTIIVNLDDSGCLKLIESVQDYIVENKIEVRGFTITGESKYACEKVYDGLIIANNSGKRTFELEGNLINMNVVGDYNVSNAVAVLAASDVIGADISKVIEGIENFETANRRMQVIKNYDNGTVIINDYAHHHTQVKNALKAAREMSDERKLVAVFEAHQISRLNNHMQEYADALKIADKIYVTPVFVGREAGKALPDMQKFLDMINHDNAFFVNEEPEEVAKIVSKQIEGNASTVVVMGAGKSHIVANNL